MFDHYGINVFLVLAIELCHTELQVISEIRSVNTDFIKEERLMALERRALADLAYFVHFYHLNQEFLSRGDVSLVNGDLLLRDFDYNYKQLKLCLHIKPIIERMSYYILVSMDYSYRLY